MVGVAQSGDITALAHVLNEYPAPVILADVHAGLLAEAVVALRENAHWHLEVSRLLAPNAIQAVVGVVGASRLLFGSNAPSHPIASALDTLHYAGLSDADRQQVLSANALRILKI